MECYGQLRFGAAGEAAASTLTLVMPCAELVRDGRADAAVDLSRGHRLRRLQPGPLGAGRARPAHGTRPAAPTGRRTPTRTPPNPRRPRPRWTRSSSRRPGAPTADPPGAHTPTSVLPHRQQSVCERRCRCASPGSRLDVSCAVLAGQRGELLGRWRAWRRRGRRRRGRRRAARSRSARACAPRAPASLGDEGGGRPVPPVAAVLEVGVRPAGGDRAQVERGGSGPPHVAHVRQHAADHADLPHPPLRAVGEAGGRAATARGRWHRTPATVARRRWRPHATAPRSRAGPRPVRSPRPATEAPSRTAATETAYQGMP